jgi:hypothetical protein
MATVQAKLPHRRATKGDLGADLRTRKLVDASILVTWVVTVGVILWLLDAAWMVANILLMAAPLAYILLRAPQVRTMIRWKFVARFVLFITVFFDYLCVKYDAWAGPSMFPRIEGVNLEQITWAAFLIPLTIAVNEYFFSRQGPEHPSTVTRPILMTYFFAGFAVALVPGLNAWLADYTYIKIGLLLYPIMFVLVAVFIPSVLREVFLTGLVMAFFNLGFEMLALHGGFWTFPGEYIGEVTIFGYAFPTEEFIFMLCFCSAGVVATYALYKNWKSMASPFLPPREPNGRRARTGFLVASCCLVLLQACGSGDKPISSQHSGDKPISSQQASRRILLTEEDLPPGSEAAEEPPLDSRCIPSSYFKDFVEAVSTSPGYYLPDSLLVQQGGVFSRPSESRRALRLLVSEPMQRCLERKMQDVSLQFGGVEGRFTAKVLSSHVPGVETRTIQIRFVTRLGWTEAKLTVLAAGPALTVLGFTSQNQPLKQSTWQGVSAAAAKKLNQVSEALEG